MAQPVSYETVRHLITLRSQPPISSSTPWSWTDLIARGSDAGTPAVEPSCPPGCIHTDCNKQWSNYPQSLFPDWTPSHMEESGIARAVMYRPCENGKESPCIVGAIDFRYIYEPGDCYTRINPYGVAEKPKEYVVFEESKDKFYGEIQDERPNDICARLYFVENLSGPVLQMLGTKYNMDPLFFSSMSNWVPLRRRYNSEHKQHTMVIFPFLRTMQKSNSNTNTKSQLRLSPDVTLVLDLLAIYTLSDPLSILSFHPSSEHLRRSRIWDPRQRALWQFGFRHYDFIHLMCLWCALHAWDEALELLGSHVSAMELEARKKGDVQFIESLHLIRLRLFDYSSTLQDFRSSVLFVRDFAGPTSDERNSLLGELDRLEKRMTELSTKLGNLIHLTESRCMYATAKQVTYLLMLCLPASFVLGIFLGMRGSIARFFGTAILLIVLGMTQAKFYSESQATLWPRIRSFPFFRKWFGTEDLAHR